MTKQIWNKTISNWWFYGLANYKWITVYPEEQRWVIFNQKSDGSVIPLESGYSESAQQACDDSIKKAAELNFIPPHIQGDPTLPCISRRNRLRFKRNATYGINS
mgnify:CR=1 FL=1